MKRENVMMRKKWNYVERKGIEACVLRVEKNGKEKRMLVKRKDKREWLEWV